MATAVSFSREQPLVSSSRPPMRVVPRTALAKSAMVCFPMKVLVLGCEFESDLLCKFSCVNCGICFLLCWSLPVDGKKSTAVAKWAGLDSAGLRVGKIESRRGLVDTVWGMGHRGRGVGHGFIRINQKLLIAENAENGPGARGERHTSDLTRRLWLG